MFEFFLKKKVLANLITVFIVAAGIVSLLHIKRATYPNVEFDILKIATTYPGASAEDVEINVTKKIEDEIMQVSDIDKVLSNSLENLSLIYVWVDSDSDDKDQVKDEIRRAVDRVGDFPEEVDTKPQIQELKSSNVAVIELAISGDVAEEVLRKIAKDFEDKIREIKGVSSVEKVGYRKKEVKILADTDALEKNYISINDLIAAIQNRNIRESGGDLKSFSDEKKIVTFAEFLNPLDVKDVIIRKNFDGHQIKLSEVTDIDNSYEDHDVVPRTNQKTSINLLIRQQSNSDIIDISEAIKDFVDQGKATLPPGVDVSVVIDYSHYTKNLLKIVQNNAIFGFILVLACLFIFLNRYVAFWTAVGVPVSFLGAILLFPLFHIDINFISLITLVLVLGMLVDDAIVVAENISRYREEGMPSYQAALLGVKEVFWPVTATIVTTIVAFLSISFMTGITGKFIQEIPIVVILALGISLAESVLILPSHIAGSPLKKGKTRGWFDRLKERYGQFILKVIRFRGLTFLAFTCFFLLAVVLAVFVMKFELFPYDDVDVFYVVAEMPDGTSLDQTSGKIKEVEVLVEDISHDSMVNYTTRVGHHDMDVYGVTAGLRHNWALVTVFLKPAREREIKSEIIMKSLSEKLKSLHGFSKLYIEKFNDGPPVGMPITVRFVSNDDHLRREFSRELFDFLKKTQGVNTLDIDEKIGKEELLIKPDYETMARLGITSKNLADTIRVAYSGIVATSITREGEKIDFRVQLKPSQRSRLEILKNLQVANNQGKLIKVGAFTHLEPSHSYESIRHYNGRQSITITGDVDTSVVTSREINQLIHDKFQKRVDQEPGLQMVFGGEEQATNESMHSFAVAFVFSFIAIYFILVVLFDSFIQPFVILAIVPFGLSGAICSFFVFGFPISFLGLIGCLGLVGVMVNDSLVMMSHLNNMDKEHGGVATYEQMAQGCVDRLRPVLLTTITTVMGLLPTIFGLGGYEPFIVPLVLALAGGLVFATPITLLLVPTLYSFCVGKKQLQNS